jgi:uncharacterized protein
VWTRFRQRYAGGIVKEGWRVSVITAGLGMSGGPIRFLAPPDYWIVTIGP